MVPHFYKSFYKFSQISLPEKLYFKFQTKIPLSYIGHLINRIHIRYLKISNPGWDSCVTFPVKQPQKWERDKLWFFFGFQVNEKTCNEKKMRNFLRPTMSLIPMTKPFKRPILQEQFIKRFIKLENQMCELQETTQALTRGSQRLRLTVNVQIGLPRPILQGFIKLKDQICELNYRGTKSEIKDKVVNQFYNFAFLILNSPKTDEHSISLRNNARSIFKLK